MKHYCHLEASISDTPAPGKDYLEWGAPSACPTIYATSRAALEALRAFAKALPENGAEDVYDFTDDGPAACVEWTDKDTGKRMKRWVSVVENV